MLYNLSIDLVLAQVDEEKKDKFKLQSEKSKCMLLNVIVVNKKHSVEKFLEAFLKIIN